MLSPQSELLIRKFLSQCKGREGGGQEKEGKKNSSKKQRGKDEKEERKGEKKMMYASNTRAARVPMIA